MVYADRYWRWDNGADGVQNERVRIDTDDIYFPPDFLFGVTTSAHSVRFSNSPRSNQLA